MSDRVCATKIVGNLNEERDVTDFISMHIEMKSIREKSAHEFNGRFQYIRILTGRIIGKNSNDSKFSNNVISVFLLKMKLIDFDVCQMQTLS